METEDSEAGTYGPYDEWDIKETWQHGRDPSVMILFLSGSEVTERLQTQLAQLTHF